MYAAASLPPTVMLGENLPKAVGYRWHTRRCRLLMMDIGGKGIAGQKPRARTAHRLSLKGLESAKHDDLRIKEPSVSSALEGDGAAKN